MSEDKPKTLTLADLPPRPFDDCPYIPVDYWDALTPVYLSPSFFDSTDGRKRVQINLDRPDDDNE